MPRKTKQNKICTPELLEKVNPENKQLISDFLSYLKSVQRSTTTISGYTNDLEIWSVWNFQFNKNKFFCDLTKRNVVAYQDWLLNTNGNSPARVRRLKSTLSALGNYVETVLDEEYPGYRNIINKIPAPVNEAVREKTVFTDEQLQSLLDVLMENGQYQKACAVALAICSGARKAELTRFKTWYFTDDNIIFGSLYKTPEKIKTKGRGANGKQLHKYTLVQEFKPYFDAWMNEREKLGISSEWLFVSKNSAGEWEQMRPEGLNNWANNFSKMMGVDFYWHANRHYLNSRLLRLSIPESVCQTLFGWSTLDMVHVYDDRPQDSVLSQYFGEDGIKINQSTNLSDL